MVFHTPNGILGIMLFKIGANSDAKASAAKALDKNPAKVIPICIVDKNLLGDFNIFAIFFAFLFPSFAIKFILASFKDINAISVAAKYAFISIKIIKTIICIFFSYVIFFISINYIKYL